MGRTRTETKSLKRPYTKCIGKRVIFPWQSYLMSTFRGHQVRISFSLSPMVVLSAQVWSMTRIWSVPQGPTNLPLKSITMLLERYRIWRRMRIGIKMVSGTGCKLEGQSHPTRKMTLTRIASSNLIRRQGRVVYSVLMISTCTLLTARRILTLRMG